MRCQRALSDNARCEVYLPPIHPSTDVLYSRLGSNVEQWYQVGTYFWLEETRALPLPLEVSTVRRFALSAKVL